MSLEILCPGRGYSKVKMLGSVGRLKLKYFKGLTLRKLCLILLVLGVPGVPGVPGFSIHPVQTCTIASTIQSVNMYWQCGLFSVLPQAVSSKFTYAM